MKWMLKKSIFLFCLFIVVSCTATKRDNQVMGNTMDPKMTALLDTIIQAADIVNVIPSEELDDEKSIRNFELEYKINFPPSYRTYLMSGCKIYILTTEGNGMDFNIFRLSNIREELINWRKYKDGEFPEKEAKFERFINEVESGFFPFAYHELGAYVYWNTNKKSPDGEFEIVLEVIDGDRLEFKPESYSNLYELTEAIIHKQKTYIERDKTLEADFRMNRLLEANIMLPKEWLHLYKHREKQAPKKN
jgi:hypothetical protein